MVARSVGAPHVAPPRYSIHPPADARIRYILIRWPATIGNERQVHAMATRATSDEQRAERSAHAVLWDVDGVIIDSAEQHRQSWKQLAEENAFPYTDEAFWHSFGRRN